MNEAGYKLALVKSIRAEGGYARRFEDKFSVGQPDTVLIPIGCPVIWAEVKLVPHQSFGPTTRQHTELLKLQIAPHSTAVVIGVKHSRLYVSRPKKTVTLDECVAQLDGETPSDLLRRFLNI